MKKTTLFERIKHFFGLLSFIFRTILAVLRNKRTWIAVAFILWSYLVAYFNANYYAQSPVKEWQPIVIPRHTKKAIVVPVVKAQEIKPTPIEEKPYIWTTRIENLYQKIRTMESGKGTNTNKDALHNKCKAKGQINEIGYLVTPDYCFMDEEHQKLTFSRWINKRINMTDEQLLCFWNTGIMQNSCSYSIYAEQI